METRIAKFKISNDEAFRKIAEWASSQKYVPKDFDINGLKDKIKKIYVPVFLFDVSAESSWHGCDYHTESRTVTKSRYNYTTGKNEDYVDNEEYEVEHPQNGMNYSNYFLPIVAMSGGITQDEIEILNNDLKMSELQSYNKSYLDGSDVWAADLNKTDALEICKQRVEKLEIAACNRKVSELHGCSTKTTFRDSHFALLPMFILTYGYKNERFNNLIDGRSGKVIGSIPVDKTKKLLVNILQVAAVILVMIILLILFL